MDKQVSMPVAFGPVRLSPDTLFQSILPNWSFSGFTINLGSSSNPELEREALDRIGSYGRQIGHLAEAMEVIIRKLGLSSSTELSQQERDALQMVLGNVASVRQLKSRLPPSP